MSTINQQMVASLPKRTEVTNISAYKFAPLLELRELRAALTSLTRVSGLKGTILLSHEGINLFVAGSDTAIESLLDFLHKIAGFEDLEPKRSYSQSQPFRRMLVKIKKEIIAFGIGDIEPGTYTSRKISPQDLCTWLDEQRDFTLLDVRNDYEVRLGTFESAIPVGVSHFRNFSQAVSQADINTKRRPVVMFCTGGIRCEKAGPFLESLGFENVFQLEGGILKYFEQCQGKHYRGDCFVFDQRVAVDPQLRETDAVLCFACRSPLTWQDQQSNHYVVGTSCPYCYLEPEQRVIRQLQQRQKKLAQISSPLPGSIPYTNRRFFTVPREADGMMLVEYLRTKFPFHRPESWLQRIEQGYVRCRGTTAVANTILRQGDRIENIFPNTVEPNVNGNVQLIHEDDYIVVANKPAPLPMHPCGRFNRNTLVSLLNRAYYPQRLRLAHRLDANTTGVVVFSRSKQVAQIIQTQFQTGGVEKYYVARVLGDPSWDNIVCQAPIGKKADRVGARYVVEQDGFAAETQFTVLNRFVDKTTLLGVRPITGRTNQIRVHAWHLGLPIIGDPTYLAGGGQGNRQTLDAHSSPMCLHAAEISFNHPHDGRVTYKAALPSWASHASPFV